MQKGSSILDTSSKESTITEPNYHHDAPHLSPNAISVTSAEPQPHILLVEDDRRLVALISTYLEKQGFSVKTSERGDTAVPMIIQSQPDLVILDLMLPGMDGFTVCQHIRPRYTGPILILTAREDDMD